MGVLIPILVGFPVLAPVLAGCYAPALRDCTVSCESPSDCASGQVCGNEGLCAAPEVAGRCTGSVDAALPPDARPVDAARPDGPPILRLHVQIMGTGRIVLDGRGTCSSQQPQDGDCVYDIAPGVLQRARANEIDDDDEFLGWTMGPCSELLTLCAFIPTEDTTIAAKFGRPGKTAVTTEIPGRHP